MPAQFQDLADFLDPFLELPIRGKTYRVASPSIDVGLQAQATVAIAAKVRAGEQVTPEDVASLKLSDDQEAEFTRSMLGDTFDQMHADSIPWEYVRHAARTVFMWLVSDREQAAAVWRDRGKAPKAPTDRKPKKRGSGGRTKKATSPSSSTTSPTPG